MLCRHRESKDIRKLPWMDLVGKQLGGTARDIFCALRRLVFQQTINVTIESAVLFIAVLTVTAENCLEHQTCVTSIPPIEKSRLKLKDCY